MQRHDVVSTLRRHYINVMCLLGIVENGVSLKIIIIIIIIINRTANRVDPDKRARYEPSHLDLHCLQGYTFWSVGLKELIT